MPGVPGVGPKTAADLLKQFGSFEAVFAGIKQWIADNTDFRDAESEARPTLFHITTSDAAFAKLKYRQLDIYLPIE